MSRCQKGTWCTDASFTVARKFPTWSYYADIRITRVWWFFLCTNSCLAVIKAIIVVYVVNKIASNCLLLPYKMFWKGFVHVHITYFVVGQFFTSSIGQNSLTRLDRAYSVLELDMIATFILCYLASFFIYCVFWGKLRQAGAEWHLKFLGGPCIIVMASR